MSKFIQIIDRIEPTKENMQELTEICDKAMTALHKTDKASYEHAIHELEEMAYEITKEHSEKIVKMMKPYGAKWSYEQIKDFIHSKGITDNYIHYFLVMNMMYNDYHKTAEMVGKPEDAEFYFSLSKDFITDIDSTPFKVEKYFLGDESD